MHTRAIARVHFADGITIQRQSEVEYLGCMINDQADVKKEVSAIITYNHMEQA